MSISRVFRTIGYITSCFIYQLLIIISPLCAQPQLREGWPITFDSPHSFAMHNTSNYLWTSGVGNDEGLIIGFASGRVAVLYDIDGNPLPGWPKQPLEHPDYYSTGPVFGDFEGDGNIEVSFIQRKMNSRYKTLVTYSLTGDSLAQYCKYDTLPVAVSSPQVFADLDNDGDDELLYISDSIYALDEGGEFFEGFPRGIEEPTHYSAGLTIGTSDISPDPFLIWATEQQLHASYLNIEEEMEGWPVVLSEASQVNSPVLIPNGFGWRVAICEKETLSVWNSSGQLLDGFPMQLQSQGLNNSCNYIAVGDIDGNGEEEMTFVMFDGLLHSISFDGEYLPGFPVRFAEYSWGESVSILRDETSDSALIVVANDSPLFQDVKRLFAFRYNQLLDGFPVEVDVNLASGGACVAIAPSNEGMLHIILNSNQGTVAVWDLPWDGQVNDLIWPMSSFNEKANLLYNPTVTVDVEEIWFRSSPVSMELSSLFPNPSNGAIRFHFTPAETGRVCIRVVDILGRMVWTNHLAVKAGEMTWSSWNTTNTKGDQVPSGIYIMKVGDDPGYTRKAVVLR